MSGQPEYAGRQPGYAGGQQGGAPYEEPWLDDPRGPQLDGPWWDPDSWPDWRRWLIPVGVAVLAAAIGAALVLLTGMHSGASAAAGAANPTTPARPATFPTYRAIHATDLRSLVLPEGLHAPSVAPSVVLVSRAIRFGDRGGWG